MDEYKPIDSQLYEFVGKNSTYYREKFEKIKTENKITSWNWAAALLSPMWFFYRKMYLLGIIIYVLQEFFLNVGIASAIFTGLMGNSLYLKHVEKKIAKAAHLTDDEKYIYCKEKGGTSIAMVLFYFLVTLIIRLVISEILSNAI